MARYMVGSSCFRNTTMKIIKFKKPITTSSLSKWRDLNGGWGGGQGQGERGTGGDGARVLPTQKRGNPIVGAPRGRAQFPRA